MEVKTAVSNEETKVTIASVAVSTPEIEESTAEKVTPILEYKADESKFSAFSISSIRAKKALEESSKSIVKEVVHSPTEHFTEMEMLLQWTKYAEKIGAKGQKIMESLLLINDPKLEGTKITFELPNEGSKLDFENAKQGLLGHLKGHLHNHDIAIEVIVNESVEIKRSLNDLDRYNRLKEINPAIDLLRTTFALHINT